MLQNQPNFILIAGPCQIESLDHARMMAEKCLEIIDGVKDVNFIYKSSFDKANRSSLRGARGIGIDQGLKVLETIRSEYKVPVVTDVHECNQVSTVAKVVDVLQIPAFLCRQTDLLIEVGKTNKFVNIKKGQFLAPQDMKFAAEKVSSLGNNMVTLCERGACFGYRDLVVDFRSLQIMQSLGWPVIFDATHSCMSLGGGAMGQSGGSREFVLPLLRSALAFGVQGVFVEVHQDPTNAPSDSATMLDLVGFRKAIEYIKIFRDVQQSEFIDKGLELGQTSMKSLLEKHNKINQFLLDR